MESNWPLKAEELILHSILPICRMSSTPLLFPLMAPSSRAGSHACHAHCWRMAALRIDGFGYGLSASKRALFDRLGQKFYIWGHWGLGGPPLCVLFGAVLGGYVECLPCETFACSLSWLSSPFYFIS